MRKVFNKKVVSRFCSKINMCNVACAPNNIVDKTIWKKIDLNKIENIGVVYEYVRDKKSLMQKFFPNKYEEVSRKGLFDIVQFVYSTKDNKIHCIIMQDGNERHFKLTTDNYIERIPDEINEAKKAFKKEVDGFYGYWFDGNSSEWYITDKNKHNGNYRKLAVYNSSEHMLRKQSTFCKNDILEFQDLILI